MKKALILVVMAAAAWSLGACTSLAGEEASPPSPVQAGHPVALMETSMGNIRLELREDLAPETVRNFLRYVEEGFYDGKIFHRVIDGFMIQGGGFDASMTQAKTHEPIINEAPKGLKNVQGAIAMARTSDINSATSQFFINCLDNPSLDHVPGDPRHYGYAAFGKVVSGLDVVLKISRTETGPYGYFRDVPRVPVYINRVTVEKPKGQ